MLKEGKSRASWRVFYILCMATRTDRVADNNDATLSTGSGQPSPPRDYRAKLERHVDSAGSRDVITVDETASPPTRLLEDVAFRRRLRCLQPVAMTTETTQSATMPTRKSRTEVSWNQDHFGGGLNRASSASGRLRTLQITSKRWHSTETE